MEEEIRKQYEIETGKKWFTVPFTRGEQAFASWGYQLWLEKKISQVEPEVKNIDMKNEIEQQIFEKMKAKDFGESMCNETKLNVLKWTMQQLHKHDVVGRSEQLPCGDCENYAQWDNGIRWCSVCGTKLS